ncbi:MAG: serine/threonine-protein kinase [Polyangiaceae bacterium]
MVNRSVVPKPPESGADVDAAASDGLPKRFGKYTLLRKLATGGMAELFLALQKSVAGFEKLIVIKRILPAMNADRAFIDMLLHEARIAATLSHPNIVQIFDVGQVDGTYFIAMEHVHGEDIRSMVRQMKKKGYPTFPREHALGIVMGMCAGLSYAHERSDLDGTPLGIVHRDISPQNVVVTFSGDVKIVDFGIAKSDNKGIEQTKSGKLKGKVPYMSPEQARGDDIDHRSDIFAMGVMLFELTTGRRLFKGASEYETLKLICDRDYPRPSQVLANYPPALERIVMRALEKDRDERYQSARDMQSDLEAFIRDERVAVSTVAMNAFMQKLFEDKLASQKEALMQGKQLAEIIDAQSEPPPPPSEYELGAPRASQASILSMPAASRTVTEIDANRPAKSKVPWVIAALAILVGGGALGGLFYVKHQNAVKAQQAVAATTIATPHAAPKGSVAIDSDPPGASIWINGDLRAETTPATIGDLPLDSAIEVKLTKDGFEQARETLSISESTLQAKLSEKLVAGSVSVNVNVLPALASRGLVVLVDGKKLEGTSATGLSSGNQHTVIVSSPGYVDQSVSFLGSPQESKHLDVTLQKEPTHKAHVGGVLPPPTGAGAIPAGSGKLNVGASGGWCNVTVDGSAKGATPVAGVDLPAGSHKVVCTTADGKAQSANVNVTPNDTTRYRFNL